MRRRERLYFLIGGKVQTKEDFQRQIEARFQGHFKQAWEEAMDYVRQFPRETLLSANGFYSDVYRPRRDELAEKWSEMSQKRVIVVKRRTAPTKKKDSAKLRYYFGHPGN